MKFLWNKKDGGPESKVWMYGIEIKSLFSLLLLRFEPGSREAYHSHAFNAWSVVLGTGRLYEDHLYQFSGGEWTTGQLHEPGAAITTKRRTLHKVFSLGRTWVISFRGPWAKTWCEYNPATKQTLTLTHGRVEVTS